MLILILIDVQYSQKAVFGFSNHQNHSSGSLHPVKNPPLSKISNSLPTPYCYLENPVMRY